MCISKRVRNVYIYKNVNGKIVEIPAFIVCAKNDIQLLSYSAFDRDNNNYLMEIASESGMPFRDTVWFEEKNFDKAKSIFMSDLSARLQKLYEEERNLKDQLTFIDSQKEV